DIAFGMTCNLWPYKGVDEFQEAFAAAGAVHRNVRAFVAGRDVGTREGLESRSRRLGIAERFTFLGERPDVCRLLSGFDVFVSASRGEGMSNAILEAMIHSLPIVASRAGGSSELVDEGRAGLLFDAGDATSLAREMISLAGTPSLRSRLGAAAADYARSRARRVAAPASQSSPPRPPPPHT